MSGGDDPVAALEAAAEDLAARRDAVAEHGEADLERVREAHEAARDLLDRHGEDITGTGEFAEYISFQGDVATLVEDLPEELPRRPAFEEFSEALHRRQLRERDLARARDALDRAGELAALLEDLEAARERYREARSAVVERRDAVADRIDHLETVQSFADVDLDADLASLRDPVETYNAAVREAFVAFRRSASAREALATLDAAATSPLVPVESPPEDLRAYVADHPVGEESLTTLREYADYSPSKLDHYVEDGEAFRRRVGANVAYLDRLDPAPFTVAWPPPPADRLRWRLEELVGAVARFADEAVVADLHALRERVRAEDYPRLRRVARAREALSERERERLRTGAVADDLADRRAELARLEDALDAHDPL